MNYNNLINSDSQVSDILSAEQRRQREGIELIPSENYVSEAVLEALGTVFTNKYSEGYPGNRYYGGQEYIDKLEQLAIDRAKQLFKADHANVQPHSGAPANSAVYLAILKPGDTVLGMDLSHGGHLTHGHPVTQSAQFYNFIRYKMKDVTTGELDYEQIRTLALEHKPKILLAGFSSYPREVDYAKMKEIADEVGAVTVMDASHIAGLIAAGELPNPFDSGFDIITTTTHKTLRGPRGGLILCRKEFATAIDKAVFPGLQGGPHMNTIAAKAVAFGEALQPEFKEYANQILVNAQAMAQAFAEAGVELVTGGTSNHLLLVDTIKNFEIPGKQAQDLLDSVGITVNKNVLPDDPRGPQDPSGIRLGTPAITTRGAKEDDIKQVVDWIVQVLRAPEDVSLHEQINQQVREWNKKFPVVALN